MPFITPHTKAIASFLAGVIVTPLAYFNINPDTPIETAITILLVALLNALAVWFSPKNK